jgi:hypothetical protein
LESNTYPFINHFAARVGKRADRFYTRVAKDPGNTAAKPCALDSQTS